MRKQKGPSVWFLLYCTVKINYVNYDWMSTVYDTVIYIISIVSDRFIDKYSFYTLCKYEIAFCL